MRSRLFLLVCAAAAALPFRAVAAEPTLAFERAVLPNGLTVVLHEDHTIPEVVVDLSVGVGARDEVRGRTGFAHLFEHLMFMGTRRAPTGVFDALMEGAGGWNNAWTSADRTGFHDVLPPTALRLALWLEADRLADLGPSMTREKLDAQRDIVRNERRQSSENRPYGRARLRLPELLYPSEHPYHHPVIGSHEDLEAATVDDVRAFFREHYAPANLSLVVAGDFDRRTVLRDVAETLGRVARAPGPARPRVATPPVEPSGQEPSREVFEAMEDNVALGQTTHAWQTPRHFAPGDAELDVLAAVLAMGKASRLHKVLVFERKLAQDVDASQASQELGSRFEIVVTAKPGVDLTAVDAVIDAEIARLAKEGPTARELERVKNSIESAFVHRLESLKERASLLNSYEAEVGDPGYLSRDLGRYRPIDAAAVAEAARRYLRPDRRVRLHVRPASRGGRS